MARGQHSYYPSHEKQEAPTGKVDFADDFVFDEGLHYAGSILRLDMDYIEHTGGQSSVEEELGNGKMRLWRKLTRLENDTVASSERIDERSHAQGSGCIPCRNGQNDSIGLLDDHHSLSTGIEGCHFTTQCRTHDCSRLFQGGRCEDAHIVRGKSGGCRRFRADGANELGDSLLKQLSCLEEDLSLLGEGEVAPGRECLFRRSSDIAD